MNISNVFNQFCNALQNRTGIMTEDNIRYYWFASMLRQDKDLNHYSLEEPYQTLSGKEMDLYYQDNNDELYFEIKFHRNNGKSDYHQTSAAGEIFDDLQRLKLIKTSKPQTHCYFLYVTDDIMHNYFISGRQQDKSFGKQLKNFYNPQINDPINLNFKGAPKTFLDSANKSLNNQNLMVFPNLQLILSRDFTCGSTSFNGDCHVRLYVI